MHRKQGALAMFTTFWLRRDNRNTQTHNTTKILMGSELQNTQKRTCSPPKGANGRVFQVVIHIYVMPTVFIQTKEKFEKIEFWTHDI